MPQPSPCPKTLRNEPPIPPQASNIASQPRGSQWQIDRLAGGSGDWPLPSRRRIVSNGAFGQAARVQRMTANLPLQSGGQLVVAALRAHGVEMAFSVAGESYLEVLDALYDAPEIRLI